MKQTGICIFFIFWLFFLQGKHLLRLTNNELFYENLSISKLWSLRQLFTVLSPIPWLTIYQNTSPTTIDHRSEHGKTIRVKTIKCMRNNMDFSNFTTCTIDEKCLICKFVKMIKLQCSTFKIFSFFLKPKIIKF